MIRKIVIANWKMNPQSQKEAETLLLGILNVTKKIRNTKIIICPPFPFLYIFKEKKLNQIKLGAQNVSGEITGPHTGEVSSKMLVNMGVNYVIVGHSECRSLGETNQIINKKIINILKTKLIPILCIGEHTRDLSGDYLTFIKNQILECLFLVPKSQIKNIIIAYEPIWAIGKNANREATLEEFIEIRIFIKKVISDLYDIKTAKILLIIYGGSVNPLNTKIFINEGLADGLLIGRDSLNFKKFTSILNSFN